MDCLDEEARWEAKVSCKSRWWTFLQRVFARKVSRRKVGDWVTQAFIHPFKRGRNSEAGASVTCIHCVLHPCHHPQTTLRAFRSNSVRLLKTSPPKQGAFLTKRGCVEFGEVHADCHGNLQLLSMSSFPVFLFLCLPNIIRFFHTAFACQHPTANFHRLSIQTRNTSQHAFRRFAARLRGPSQRYVGDPFASSHSSQTRMSFADFLRFMPGKDSQLR
jgi:hypothetical protein